ncbi:MAG: nucleoside hydrolase [candidate division NC10 bacterium]|nr:nucleoside hydrolase [candidate division NC10 bacterium]
MKPRSVILDVDTGVDDALAIMLALRSPELEIKGILTVSGNVHVSQTTANTLTVLDLLGAPPIPVVAGAAAPLARPGITAGDVHGGDGLGGVAGRFPPSRRAVTEDGVGFLLEAIGRQPGQLTLIATAPLTNIALAIGKDAPTMRKLRAVPLDVTERVVLTRQHLDSINPAGKLHAFVKEIVAATMAFHRMHGEGEGIILHDPLAVGVALDASLVRRERMALAVETQGALTAGMAVADLRRRRRAAPTADVCVEVETQRFLRLFTERVLR